MLYVWLATVFGCISLSLILLWRRHYVCYGWLTTSAILAPIVDAYFAYVKYFHHSFYLPSRQFIFFLWLGLSGLIAFEAWQRGNKWVQIPQEIQIALSLILLLLRKDGGNVWAIYYVDCSARIVNLLMILGFMVLFNRSTFQLKEFINERTPRAYGAEEA